MSFLVKFSRAFSGACRFLVGSLLILVFLFAFSTSANAQKSSSNKVIRLDFKNFSTSQSEFWCENWLGGWGLWYPDNGVWDVGVPTSGPGSAYSDSMCAGTVLNGNYPGNADSRLISPPIAMPASPQDGALWLRFWHWFSMSDDYGRVEMSVDGGGWQVISPSFVNYGARWTKHLISLPDSTVGRSVRFGFRFVSGTYNAAAGWYIDDICVVEGQCESWTCEDFKGEVDCWFAERGVWQIGEPTSGPGSAYSRSQCAATVLSGDYPGNADSRLISPPIALSASPQDGALWLSFWHWFSMSDDYGRVEISVDGGGWQVISPNFVNYGARWTKHIISLPDSTFGRSVRFGFRFVSGTYNTAAGWYVDDICVVEGQCDPWAPETFESNVDCWFAERGVWQIGEPTYGADAYQGSECAATVLNGDYPGNADSRLISPPIALPASPQNGALWLSFWHWFSMYDDYGRVEMSVDAGGWQVISPNFVNYGARWTKHIISLPDSIFGRSVRFAFRFVSGTYNTAAGWFIDLIEIQEGDFQILNPNFFESNSWTRIPYFDGWYASNGVWEVGNPSSGPGGSLGGYSCAATVLSGNYPGSANSRLISPTIVLPASSQDDALWLSFWHWFSMYDDYGVVAISVDGGEWQEVTRRFYNYGGAWTQYIVDLSAYLGHAVRFSFHFVSGSYNISSGWYIDNMSLSEGKKIFNNPEGFEGGTRGWWSSQGVWQIGESASACSGNYCAGTRLSGNYPGNADTRLITPSVTLPASSMLRFMHRFSFANGDGGYVEISVDGGAWSAISSTFSGYSWSCSPYIVDLASYSGQSVRFAFHFTSDTYSDDVGWYIDDIQIIGASEEVPDGPTFTSVDYTSAPPALAWDNPTGDFDFISIYAGQDPDFIPDLGSRIALVTGTSFNDVARPGWGTYYKISTVKQYGDVWHESPPTGPITVTAVEEDTNVTPSATKLMQNFPNPFNPITSIKFTLADAGRVSIAVYNAAGMRVATLLDEHKKAGEHTISFDAHGLSSGVYFYRLQTPGVVQTRKMVILR